MSPVVIGVIVAIVVVIAVAWRKSAAKRKAREQESHKRRVDRALPYEQGWSSRTSTPAARKVAEQHRDEEYRRTMAVPDPLFDDPDDLLPAKVALLHSIAPSYEPASHVGVRPVAHDDSHSHSSSHSSHSSDHSHDSSGSYDSGSSDSGSSDGGSSSSD